MKIAITTTDNRENFRTYHLPEPYFGTAPEALLQGLAQLPENEIHVISCAQKPLKSPEKLAPNIWFHSLYVPKTGWLRTSYQGCIRAVRRCLKTIQPDIVHGQGTERDCAINAVFSRFPNVVTIHGNMAELARLFRARMGTYPWLAAQLEHITLKRTTGVFCNSQYTEELVKPRARRTWRVPNPVRQAFFEPAAPRARSQRPILVNVGTVTERKRQVELLEVARQLHQRGFQFEMQFIGFVDEALPYSTEFRRQLAGAEKEGYARHLGMKNTEELVAIFDGADAMVHFPSEEAFGLVVAEALARNLKLFAAKLGGIVDIAQVPGAELFGAEDFAALTDGIGRWLQSGCPRPQGLEAVMRDRYHPKKIAERHLEIYREVLSKPS